jgi:RNA polymerase sigma-70 factor (ECF subfamily)
MNTQHCTLEGTHLTVSEADWEAVYRELLPRVYNYFRARVGDEALAGDLTGVTFEKAWRARARYDRDLGAFTAWIFSIARRAAVDHYRRRRPELALEDVSPGADPAPVEEAVQHRDEFARLSALLAGLPPRERELVALKYGGRMTAREIARLTRLSETNVTTILSRAVGRIRAQWEAEDER